jgi:glycerol-3-phosphate dehydrogenase
VLSGASSADGLGREIEPGLYEAELDYLVSREWARTVEDVLWRRSKLGLLVDEDGRAWVAAWMRRNAPDPAAAASEIVS